MRFLSASLLLISVSGFAFSQTFEVVSIKPNSSGDHRVGIQMAPGGRYTATNVNAKMLMQQAYGIKDFQISGAPGWMSSERFDITAKADDSAVQGRIGPDQLKPMLQALLTDRFKLTFHKDTKEMPIYALVVGKNGPKIHPVEQVDGDAPSGDGARPRGQMRMGRGQINAQQIAMPMFVTQLSMALGRSVIDKTGLKGNFDIKLEWTPEEGEMRGMGGPGGGDTAPPSDATGPSIFTAVQEQLGLKLESDKGPVETFVIDRVEKPSEN